MDRRAWVIAGAFVVAIVVILVWADPLGFRGSEAPLDEATEEEAAWEEDWMLDPPDPEEPRARADREGRPDRQRRRPDRGSPEWQERRARRLERWRSAVDIAPLGPEPPRFDADAIREALRPGRAALRSCIDEAGGWRAMREAVRGSRGEGERRPRRTVTFDVTSEGSVDPASIAMQPPMPAPFDACFRSFYASGRFAEPGDGARVEVPMGGRGGRRRGRGGDGGV